MCKLLQNYTIPLSSDIETSSTAEENDLSRRNSDEITVRHASVQYCNNLQENRWHNFDNRHDISYRTEQDRFEQKFVDYDVTMDI